jgi:hypothetical protein
MLLGLYSIACYSAPFGAITQIHAAAEAQEQTSKL